MYTYKYYFPINNDLMITINFKAKWFLTYEKIEQQNGYTVK